MNIRADNPYFSRFLLLNGVLIPGVLALAAFAARYSGLDQQAAAVFFDPATGLFPARSSTLLEVLGHRFAKSAVLLVWFTLLAAALASTLLQLLPVRYRAIFWSAAGAMALGPVIVVVLKSLNSHHCPWGLRAYGGVSEFTADWFVPAAEAGYCFPSGHAAAGFSLVAMSFAGIALGSRSMARAGLAAALVAGVLFSVVRMAQGAHFLSHNLWSAAIDWTAASLVFSPLVHARRA